MQINQLLYLLQESLGVLDVRAPEQLAHQGLAVDLLRGRAIPHIEGAFTEDHALSWRAGRARMLSDANRGLNSELSNMDGDEQAVGVCPSLA